MSENLPVVSTRMNFRTLDLRLKGAQKGLALLKCKSDALQLKVREIESSLEEHEKTLMMLFRSAFRLHANAMFCGTDMRLFTKMCVSLPSTVECELTTACGVTMTNFTVKRKELDPEVLWKNGYVFKKMKDAFDELLASAASLATLKSSLNVLKQQLESTNKRKNSLEHRQIPRLESAVEHIEGELDEMEREEFFRLKRVQEMKLEREM